MKRGILVGVYSPKRKRLKEGDVSYTISETEIQSVWQVVFEGSTSSADRMSAVEKGLKATEGKKLSGILVDLTAAESTLSTFDEYSLGERVASLPQFQGVRIAFLHAPNEEKSSQFLENVEANRGAITSIFTDRNQAMSWLSGKK